ncbi:hypothetical protein AML29_14670 [Escherichia coli]|nr:hypothetical protein AML35_09165 [Escherichia coli]KYT39817.1 hypothetical protein AML29_14670 [Escherichia coli]OKB78960.1 hypothetical protein BMT49_11940 [Escherichia coli]
MDTSNSLKPVNKQINFHNCSQPFYKDNINIFIVYDYNHINLPVYELFNSVNFSNKTMEDI